MFHSNFLLANFKKTGLSVIQSKDFWLLAILVSISCYCAYLFSQVPFTLYYASVDYYSYARDFILGSEHLGGENTSSIRTLGYPLFLVGATFGTLQLSLIAGFQLLLPVAVVMIGYLLLRKAGFSPAKCFIFMIATQLSLVFFSASRTILNEQLYSVLLFLSFCVALIWYVNRSRHAFLALCFLLLFASLVRPTSFLLFCLFVFFFPHMTLKKRFLNSVISFCMVLLAMQISSVFHARLDEKHTSGTGILAVMNPIVASGADSSYLFKETDGSYSARLIEMMVSFEQSQKGQDALKQYLKKNGDLENVKLEEDCLSASAGGTSCLLNMPTLETYWITKWQVIRQLGMKEADAFYKSLFIEKAKASPKLYAYFWFQNFLYFLQGGNKHFGYKIEDKGELVNRNMFRVQTTAARYTDQYAPFFSDSFIADLKEHNKGLGLARVKSLHRYIYKLWSMITVVHSLALILALWFIGETMLNTRRTLIQNVVTLSFLIFVFHAALISVVHPPLGRYVLPLMPTMILLIISVGLELKIRVDKLRKNYALF